MDIQSVTMAMVKSAYVGRAYKCCCGCSGDHIYPSSTRATAAAECGHAVVDGEVDNARVAEILATVVNCPEAVDEGDHIYCHKDKKIYIVYISCPVRRYKS